MNLYDGQNKPLGLLEIESGGGLGAAGLWGEDSSCEGRTRARAPRTSFFVVNFN